MRPAIIFDDGLGQLTPLTDLRPAYDLRTGALTTLERLTAALDLQLWALCVPMPLLPLAAERERSRKLAPGRAAHDGTLLAVNDLPQTNTPFLCINARCALPHEGIGALQPGEAIVEAESGHLVAAVMESHHLLQSSGPAPASRIVAEFPAPALLSRPWHVRTFRDRCLAIDLDLIAAAGGFDPAPVETVVVGSASRVKIHPSARLYPSVVLDTEPGMIVIDEHATVRPGSVITGPVYIGPHSTVLDRAVIRGNTVIGPHCKVAGEVSGTIFQGFANKAHDGFLGDSYVGEWANLGAGTTNSNLLNTYSEVLARVSAASSVERTGETFLGCIIGDHAKFAICTRIMTGSVVHTGAMWAASAPVSGCVAPFAWVTDAGAKRYRFEKFAEVARAVMGRRKEVPSEAYLGRLGELHSRSAS